jgi:hypothetical protein
MNLTRYLGVLFGSMGADKVTRFVRLSRTLSS